MASAESQTAKPKLKMHGIATETPTPDEGRPTDNVEALADAWASIDGRVDRFRANRDNRDLDLTDGAYPGYMEDARSMLEGLERRGFVVVPKETIDG